MHFQSETRTFAGLAGLLADACCLVSARSFGGGRAGHHLPFQWWLCHLGDCTLLSQKKRNVGHMKLGIIIPKYMRYAQYTCNIYFHHIN